MQVENIHLVECIHQALPHAPESGVVQIAVIGNHADNTCSGHVDFPLGKTDKFDIIILQPFWIFFSKWLPIYLIVAFNTIEVFLQKFFGPIVLIFRMSAVGWIAKDNQNGFLFFTLPAKWLSSLNELSPGMEICRSSSISSVLVR